MNDQKDEIESGEISMDQVMQTLKDATTDLGPYTVPIGKDKNECMIFITHEVTTLSTKYKKEVETKAPVYKWIAATKKGFYELKMDPTKRDLYRNPQEGFHAEHINVIRDVIYDTMHTGKAVTGPFIGFDQRENGVFDITFPYPVKPGEKQNRLIGFNTGNNTLRKIENPDETNLITNALERSIGEAKIFREKTGKTPIDSSRIQERTTQLAETIRSSFKK